jgi:hypothetical protein
MSWLDRLLGREPRPAPSARTPSGANTTGRASARTDDEVAIERYRYLLRTAPPDRIEEAHAEAFARLTPEQRQQVLEQVGHEVPEGERATSTEPRDLARMATRAEMRNPGALERSLGGRGGAGMGGIGMGGLIAGSLLSSVAGAFIGTAVADAMFDMSDTGEAGGEDPGGEDPGAGDPGADPGGDYAAGGLDGGFDGGFDGGDLSF